jgi:hypothetical protein
MPPLIAQGYPQSSIQLTRKKANAENPHWPYTTLRVTHSPRLVEVVQLLAAVAGNILNLFLAERFDTVFAEAFVVDVLKYSRTLCAKIVIVNWFAVTKTLNGFYGKNGC